MGSRIVFPGMIFVCGPCPYGCNEVVSIKIDKVKGEKYKNCECPGCKGKVHAFHYDDVVREGHFE